MQVWGEWRPHPSYSTEADQIGGTLDYAQRGSNAIRHPFVSVVQPSNGVKIPHEAVCWSCLGCVLGCSIW